MPSNSLRPLRAISLWLTLWAAAWGVSAQPTQPAQTYVVKSGDTVDKVIRQTMGQSPLRPELLRQALIQQNPQAFSKSSLRVLIPGSVLTLPNVEEVLRMNMSSATANGQAPGYDPSDRKNWIRYP